jgi:hypothetical protein
MSQLPPHNNTATSFEAAQEIAPVSGKLRVQVYEFICQRGNATIAEIEFALDMLHQTASARVNELHRSKHIRDSGATRLTPTRRKAIVWEPTRCLSAVSDGSGGGSGLGG